MKPEYYDIMIEAFFYKTLSFFYSLEREVIENESTAYHFETKGFKKWDIYFCRNSLKSSLALQIGKEDFSVRFTNTGTMVVTGNTDDFSNVEALLATGEIVSIIDNAVKSRLSVGDIHTEKPKKAYLWNRETYEIYYIFQ